MMSGVKWPLAMAQPATVKSVVLEQNGYFNMMVVVVVVLALESTTVLSYFFPFFIFISHFNSSKKVAIYKMLLYIIFSFKKINKKYSNNVSKINSAITLHIKKPQFPYRRLKS